MNRRTRIAPELLTVNIPDFKEPIRYIFCRFGIWFALNDILKAIKAYEDHDFSINKCGLSSGEYLLDPRREKWLEELNMQSKNILREQRKRSLWILEIYYFQSTKN